MKKMDDVERVRKDVSYGWRCKEFVTNVKEGEIFRKEGGRGWDIYIYPEGWSSR